MAASRPVVASDLPALRDIVEHGDTAVLVAAGDPAAFAAGIRSLLDDPPGADRLASVAFDRVACYSWARRAERIEALLNDVVSVSNRRNRLRAGSG